MTILSKGSKAIRLKKVIIATICAVIAIVLSITYNGRAGNVRLNANKQATSQVVVNKIIQADQDRAEIIATGQDLPSANSSNKSEEIADKIGLSYKVFNDFLLILLALLAYDLIKSLSQGLSNLVSKGVNRVSKEIDKKVK